MIFSRFWGEHWKTVHVQTNKTRKFCFQAITEKSKQEHSAWSQPTKLFDLKGC